jgi:putative addiction module component (TIGR02574 family)
MSQAVATVLTAALALSDAERAELAELIAESLPAPPSGLHPAWGAELRRRAAEVDSGAVKPVPWDEVRKQVQAQLDAGEPANG